MPERTTFDYAMVRVVPRIDRGELMNVGVVLYALKCDYLAVRIAVDEARLKALWPELDVELVRDHLDAFARVARGEAAAGPVARLTQRERWHWLVAPRSTILQVSAVHSGLCQDPAKSLDHLFERLVR
ncbi:MAG: DUF3037 domain-containing protein [Deltaproteobacteria bacterium]|nr:DUF3037 domain-containing protein [Deltaproteobacteria bacterium]